MGEGAGDMRASIFFLVGLSQQTEVFFFNAEFDVLFLRGCVGCLILHWSVIYSNLEVSDSSLLGRIF